MADSVMLWELNRGFEPEEQEESQGAREEV